MSCALINKLLTTGDFERLPLDATLPVLDAALGLTAVCNHDVLSHVLSSLERFRIQELLYVLNRITMQMPLLGAKGVVVVGAFLRRVGKALGLEVVQ